MPDFSLKINLFQRRSQRAQGLVEFALALPILLMLVFGIIEFGRFLQAWLALENGARFGVRYAITGNFNPAYCQAAAQALALEDADVADGHYDCRVPESFSQDWEQMQNALQDWARLPSIRDAALAGATGIAWDPAAAVSGDYLAYLDYGWNHSGFDMVNRGNPALKGYFNVTTCSNRIEP
ncbi:MAG: pilus assembly protein, partial [Bellilinea sp.]|nr:pilus assembly protein [Bellilinea sp.]